MAIIKRNDDHYGAAVARLRHQYRDQPNILKLVEIMAGRFQKLEAVFWDILLSRTLDGSGAALDRIGRIIGQQREGMDEETYRIWLATSIRLNKCNGTGPEIIDLLTHIVENRIQFSDVPPAGLLVRAFGKLVFDPDILLRVLKRARSGGVDALLLYQLTDDSDTLITRGEGAPSSAARMDGGYTDGEAGVWITELTGNPFPPTGIVVLNPGEENEEFCRYVLDGDALNLAEPLVLNHSGGGLVHLAPSNGLSDVPATAVSVIYDYAPAGTGSLFVDEYALFPEAGRVCVGHSPPDSEILTYTSSEGPEFVLASPTLKEHNPADPIVLVEDLTLPFGGKLASIRRP